MNASADPSLLHEIAELRGACFSLMLATAAPDGEPLCSYAPYVEDQGRFYILVSGLARHTANLLQTPRCHVMFIADEAASTNMFARRRVSYRCQVTPLTTNDARTEFILDEFTQRFGATVGLLRTLPDFRLLELRPLDGAFVRGFGQAITFHVE